MPEKTSLDVALQLQAAMNDAARLANRKVVLLLSGGIDSTTLLYHLIAQHAQVFCILFDYGQRHRRELSSAIRIADHCNVSYVHMGLYALRDILGKSVLTGYGEVPEGHYKEGNMQATVVPNRNMIMLSIAAGYAINIDSSIIAYAAHAGDHAIYPDCRREFVNALSSVLRVAHYTPVELYTPFIDMPKHAIVARGLHLRVPYEDTWSCYVGSDVACGRCGTCVERLEAFSLAGAVDPIQYKDTTFWQEAIRARSQT